MIRIKKPKSPAILATRGTNAVVKLKAEFRRGTTPLPFDDSIYAHDDVKQVLRLAQHDKCAFCESKITHIDYGDIEHFRPKAAVRQRETDILEYPGYYWLVYKWSNLFLSCKLCNQRFKGNCFPLQNPKHRARSPRHSLSQESPRLIDPGIDYPEKHLTFIAESAVPRKGSEKGKITIEVMGLNRVELLERRLKKHNDLHLLLETYSLLAQVAVTNPSAKFQNLLQKTQKHMAEAIKDEAEYAAMARVTLG